MGEQTPDAATYGPRALLRRDEQAIVAEHIDVAEIMPCGHARAGGESARTTGPVDAGLPPALQINVSGSSSRGGSPPKSAEAPHATRRAGRWSCHRRE